MSLHEFVVWVYPGCNNLAICRCLSPDRTRHKVNDSKVGLKWGFKGWERSGTSRGSNPAGCAAHLST